MYIFLGNVTISGLEERTGWSFTEEERSWLESHRQESATVRTDSEKFHIFYMPFSIVVSPKISDELFALLGRKNEESVSNEPIQLIKATLTEEEKAEIEYKKKLERIEANKRDESKRWMQKWHLRVPITDEYDYLCFFNTIHNGYMNIPNEVSGTFNVGRDKEGLHGQFYLDSPEMNETENPEWNYIVGLGTYDHEGNRIFDHDSEEFDMFTGRIEDYLRVDESYAIEL